MRKEYKCQKCGTIFTEEVNKKFIKTVMPKCPECHSIKIFLTKTVETRAKKQYYLTSRNKAYILVLVLAKVPVKVIDS